MSLLNLAPPSGTVGANITPEDEEFKRPSTGEELRQQARATAGYQSSRARSNLAENAVNNLLEGMPPEARAHIEKRVAEYEKEKNTPDAIGWNPDEDALSNIWNLVKGDPRGANKEGEIRALDTNYDEVYREILSEEGSPINPEAFTRAMADELKRVTHDEITGQENTLSDWAFTQSMAGGFQAGLADPAEQSSIVGSLIAAPLTAGLTGLRAFEMGAAEILTAGSVTLSYQQDVIDLYKDMGLEEHYGPIDAAINVGAGMVLDAGVTVGGKAIGMTSKKLVDKFNEVQHSAIKAGMTPDEVEAATPIPIKKAKIEAEKEVVTSAPESAPAGAKKMAANRVAQVADDVVHARTVDLDAIGKAQASKGPPAPTTEVAETSAGSVAPAIAMETAKAQDGKPFNAAQVGRDFVEAQKETWIAELEADINATVPPPSDSLAHARKNIPEIKKNIAEQKETVAYEKAEAKKYEGTEYQADTRKAVKDATGDMTSMRRSLKLMTDKIKAQDLLDSLTADLKSLTETGKLAKGSRYTKQVTAAKKAAKQTHEARAAKGSTTEAVEAIEAQRTEALMDMGAMEDTRPSKLPEEGGVDMTADDAFTHSDDYFEELDTMRRQQDSDMPDMDDYDVDEDYNVSKGSREELLSDAEAMDAAAEIVRGCM